MKVDRINNNYIGFANQELESYIENNTTPESSILSQIYRDTYIKMVNPRMVSGHVQGMFLSMISRMVQPEYVLEIGTYTGYSAICLAAGLKPDGKLHTIEVDDELAEVAKAYFEESDLKNQIIQHVGDACELIPNFSQKFDLIYIDGEKREYCNYFKVCLPMLKVGGYIIADNVLWNGKVVNEEYKDDSATKEIVEFNKLVTQNNTTENVLLPLRDGLMLVRKIKD
jgi:caffeoyl-CoA O-methyltransferase